MALSQRVRRSWFRALGIGPAVMLIALLPSVLYIDHWTSYASSLLGESEAMQLSELANHSTHCHVGPSSCSDQPTVYATQVVPTVVELAHPELPAVLLEHDPPLLVEHTSAPLTEPPRA